MARNTRNTSEDTTPARTEPVEVSPELTPGLIAAWDGVFHFLGGQATWEITPDGLVAHDFSINGGIIDTETLLTDLNRKDRRVQLFPAIFWINGQEPAGFSTPQEVQAYLTQYFKGSTGDGSTRAAKYIRDAAKSYRAANMNVGRPGPKPQILKKLDALEASQLKEMSPETLEHLQSVLNEVRESQASAQVLVEA